MNLQRIAMAHTQAQFLALKASAGSGKTFSLALRFIYLLFCGANPHQILTLTFTKKASNEMRHRIYEHLHSLKISLNNNTYAANIVYKDLCEKKGLNHQILSQNIQRIYTEFMQSNPRITTIDAFFYAVLKKFCWYVGVSAYFEVGNVDFGAINERFLQSLHTQDVDSLVKFCLFHKMSIAQFLSFLHSLCLFPAQDIQNALGDDLEPIRLSPEEIDEEIKARMERINAYVQSIEGGDKRAKRLFCKSSAEEILKSPDCILKWNEHSYLKKYDLSAFDKVREEIFDLMKIYFVKKEQDVFRLLRAYLTQFNRFKQRQNRIENYLSYNDVMLKNYELLRCNIDRDFFYFRLDDKITHILLDEFQDTSLTQYQILKPIIDEIKSGDSRKKIDEKSLFVVGDEKQSIYGFRGSFSGVFDEATRDLHKENLPYNFRSKPRVIDFNNRIFQECYKQRYIPSQCPNDTIQGGYVRVLESTKDAQSLSAQVYDELESLLHNGANENQIAILVFKNEDALLLKDYINAHNPHISVVTETSTSLFSKKEVRLLLSALNYIKLLRLAQMTKNTGEESAEETLKKHSNAQFLESISQSSVSPTSYEINNALKFYEKQICKLWGRAYEESASVISKITSLSLNDSMRPAEIVLALIESFCIAQSTSMRFLELSCECGSIDEVQEMALKIQCDAPTQSNDGVKIMTIHKSKGLEFDYVIVCDRMNKPKNDTSRFLHAYDGLNIGRIYYKSRGREGFDRAYNQALEAHKNRLKQEELNVLYVAFTRAKYGLSIARKEQLSAFEPLFLNDEKDILPTLNTHIVQKQADSTKINVLQSMQHFGRQSAFIKQEQTHHIFEATQWQSIIFGNALHSVFELYLGFALNKESIAHILFNRYGFALSSKSIAQAIDYALASIENPLFSALREGKEMLCEVSYIEQSCLYRIDALLYDEKECFVLDYKSGAREQEEQKEQVRGYMRFLNTLYQQKKSIRGFIIYPLKQGSEQVYEVNI